MTHFDPAIIRRLRLRKGRTIADVASRMGVSAAQVHRLETGQRRITIDALMRYCDVLDTDIAQLFVRSPRVPVIGVIDSNDEVLPLPPNSATETIAPALVHDMQHIAAVRWEPAGRFNRMQGHLMFFYAHTEGIPESAWGRRCLIVRKQGTQRIGWPIREHQGMHVDAIEGRAEFNVEITWASPIIAVVPPLLIEHLQPSAPPASEGR